MDGFGRNDGNARAARVESLGEFSFAVVDGEALWRCQWRKAERLVIALLVGRFSFNMDEIEKFENGPRVLPRTW